MGEPASRCWCSRRMPSSSSTPSGRRRSRLARRAFAVQERIGEAVVVGIGIFEGLHHDPDEAEIGDHRVFNSVKTPSTLWAA